MPLAGQQLLARDVAALAYKHGWNNVDNLITTVAICFAESDAYDDAWHDNANDAGDVVSRDVGLMQVNIPASQIGTQVEHDLYDHDNNFAAARKLFEDRGLQPWVAYGNGSYKQFLPKATLGVANFMAIELGFSKGNVQ